MSLFCHKPEANHCSVSIADSLTGNIIQANEEIGIFGKMFFSSDRERETTDEIVIPFFVCGKGVKKNHLIAERIYTYENSAFQRASKILYLKN